MQTGFSASAAPLPLPPGVLEGPEHADPESAAAAFWSAAEPVRADHAEVSFEFEGSAERRYYEIRLLVFVGDDLIGITRNITQSKNAENELREHAQQLHHLATIDTLTQTRNRSAIFAFLTQQLAAFRSTGVPVAVIMADIDCFKRINDRYGHMVGDVVLKEIAARLVSRMRSTDAVGLYRGEEFLAVLPACEQKTATGRADQLRRCFATEPLPVPALEWSVKCSFKVSSTEETGYELDKLIGRADEALYRAKRSGGNCVCSSGATGGPPGNPEFPVTEG